MTEDEMVRQHHQFNGHEFQQTPGDSERQGSLKEAEKVSKATEKI